MTPRASSVKHRADALGVEFEWIGPTVRLNGRVMTVSNAEAWLDGFKWGLGR